MLLIEQGISFLVSSRKKNKLLNENNTERDPTQTSIICKTIFSTVSILCDGQEE